VDRRKHVLVTTTINAPTPALRSYTALGHTLVVVGDRKTPDDVWIRFCKGNNNVRFLSYEYQQLRWRVLSELIGPDCVQRRNLGFVVAVEMGADVIVTVDDDNEPLSNWGNKVGLATTCKRYEGETDVIDPLQVAGSNMWHRGFPIQRVKERRVWCVDQKTPVVPLVQSNLWHGDPDVDAIERWLFCAQNVRFSPDLWFTSCSYMPFNSQNTAIDRSLIQDYFCFPGIGRADDILASYVLQFLHADKKPFVVFGGPTVYQKRVGHVCEDDLEEELWGMSNLHNILCDSDHWFDYLPTRSMEAFGAYEEAISEAGR